MRCRRCSHSPPRVPRRERGAALIVAMLIFALAAALVVAMRGEFDRYYQRSANLLADEQMQAYLRGGEQLAAMILIRDYDDDKQNGTRDSLDEIWNSPEVKQPQPLDDLGWFQGSLEDLQGRFNLNLLAQREQDAQNPDKRFTAAQKQFIRLLQALGEPAVSLQEAIALTESVSDWLDPDQETSPDGAEDTYYSGRTPAYRAANRTLSSVSELRAVANMTPAIYLALRPWVTALPDTDTRLNILTAPPMVLRTINADDDLGPLSEDEGQVLADAGFQDIKELFDNPVFANRKDKLEEIRPLLGMNSSYFLLRARVEVAGREMRLYSVLKRQNRTVGAIARVNGPLDRRCFDAEQASGQITLEMRQFCEIPL